MASTYILYSPSLDVFYTGFTTMKASERFLKHTEDYYGNKFTSAAHDWEIFLEIVCASEKQARAIESHIKRMKSKIYITNLKRYPEMVEKLLNKYENS